MEGAYFDLTFSFFVNFRISRMKRHFFHRVLNREMVVDHMISSTYEWCVSYKEFMSRK